MKTWVRRPESFIAGPDEVLVWVRDGSKWYSLESNGELRESISDRPDGWEPSPGSFLSFENAR